MTTFSDMEPLPYFGEKLAVSLRSVGWLGAESIFKKGTTEPGVYQRLRQLLVDPFQPFVSAGLHSCELCQFEAEAHGSANLFVPADGLLLVCPGLILHYINAHNYQAPTKFYEAVLDCPDTRSMEYKRLFLASGGRGLMSISSNKHLQAKPTLDG